MARVVLVLAAAALSFGVACSGGTLPYAGGLMVAVQTDLAAPKDVAAVGLYITSDGRPIFGDTRSVAPNGEVKFPATIAVLGDTERPRAVVKIRAVAFKSNGDVRVLRDVITTIPKGRTGLLRTPLLWINEGSGSGNRGQLLQSASLRPRDATSDGFARLTSACPDGQTFLEGECGDARVDGESLPEYADKDVFGGGDAAGKGGRCFDVAACFSSPIQVALDPASCTGTLPGMPIDEPNLSFAVALPSSAEAGECLGNGSCLVPLDKGTGWKAKQGAIEFPKALCRRIADGKAKGIVASKACPSKDITTPSCGPASAVSPTGPGGGGGIDAGASASDFEAPIAARRSEPLLYDVEVDEQYIFLARAERSLPAGVIRLKKSDVTSQTQPEGFQMLFGYAPGVEQRSSIVLDPVPSAQRVVARGESGEVRLCTPTSNNDCTTLSIPGPPKALAAGQQEAYAFGTWTSTPGLYAIPYANPEPQLRSLPPMASVTALLVKDGTLFIGAGDASLYKCALPCATVQSVSRFREAPTRPVFLTALAASDKVAGKIFFMQVPVDGDASAGGIYGIDVSGSGEVQIAPGTDLGGPGAGGDPPSAIAIDSEYVYWGGGFGDPRDNARKSGLMRRSHRTRGDVGLFLEERQGTEPVTAVSVDGTHVFWTYYRADGSLMMSKKTRSF